MTQRVQEALAATWQKDVAIDYKNGLVVSESSLMSVWHFHLRRKLDETGHMVLTEPSLYLRQEGGEHYRRYKPDILVGENTPNGRRAAAIIEIKWVPFHYPDYLSDVGKLAGLAQSTAGSYCAAVCPKSGREFNYENERGKHFLIDSETLFVFAVVGRKHSEAVEESVVSAHFQRAGGDAQRFRHFRGVTETGDTFPVFHTGG